MNIKIETGTQVFCGSLMKGYKYVAVVNRRPNGVLECDIIATDMPNGDVIGSLNRDYPSNMYAAGAARAMQRRMRRLVAM